MHIIGLTGGVASGKSTVADLFAKQDVEIIDTDIIAREVVEVGKPGWQSVINHFGKVICFPDGSINRRQLRKIVFADDNERIILENLLHPLIRLEVDKRMAQVTSVYCMVIIPLLFETHSESWVNRIMVVDIPENLQLERLCQRDGITLELAKRMLHTQVSREYRLQHADDVIDNSGTFTELESQVLRYDQKYRILV